MLSEFGLCRIDKENREKSMHEIVYIAILTFANACSIIRIQTKQTFDKGTLKQHEFGKHRGIIMERTILHCDMLCRTVCLCLAWVKRSKC